MKDNSFRTYHILKAALFGAALFFMSCEENQVEALGELNRNFADRTTLNAFLVYKDSGRITFELKSPLIEEFTLIDSPYVLMRNGVNIKFWDEKSQEPSYLRADWAKMIEKKKFYEGKGNVRMINYDGDTLLTEHIFWDNLNRRIYTQDTVVIKRKDGTINISNNGLDATEDFKTFTLFDNHGVYIFDESSESALKSKLDQNASDVKTPLEENQMIPLPLEK
ncbi:LPS export ABC transporter periplasmic protein LptC [Flavobacteriaceae bacterium Ap0902]|nr:LPS export ABC transporter periplasmic protein LptC [Flavobacteriaceae bacterium Ap0902]